MVPIDMHPRSGDTSAREQIPQKANSAATDMIRRLSLYFFFGIMHFSSHPKIPPSTNTAPLTKIGFKIFPTWKPPPESAASAMEIAALYSTRPTTSSKATTCKRVSTKSPFAPVWRIVMIVDAGAVADARAASTIENDRFR